MDKIPSRRGRKLDFYEYLKLVEVFRKQQAHGLVPQYHAAAREVGVNRVTAKKAWELGLGPTMPPVSTLPLENPESLRARFKVLNPMASIDTMSKILGLPMPELSEIKERDPAKADAHDQLLREAQLVRAAQVNAGMLMAASNQLLRGAQDLVKRLAKGIEFTSQENGFAVLKEIAQLAKVTSDLTHQSMQLERLHLGRPEVIVGVQQAAELSPEELEHRIRAAEQAVLRAQQQGYLRVLDDGSAPPAEGEDGGDGSVH